MSSKWCVIVFVLWTTALTVGSNSKQGDNGLSGTSSGSASSDQGHSSAPSLSDDVKQIRISAQRVKRETEGLTLKVRLSNGSYIYRKVSVVPAAPADETGAVTRVARGYSKSKGTKKGYGYKKPKGYVYTTPKTTPQPPLSESYEENDSQSQNPPEPPPAPVSPDKSFLTTTTSAPVDDPWDIRDSVPGEPGRDYNVLGGIPQTNFSCEGKTPGFYADVETGCQVFHRCTDDPWYTGQVRVTMDSFLCPNGSLFNQQIYTCDWWGNVDCNTSPEFYQLNEQIGQLEETKAGNIQYVQFGGVRVPPPPGQKRKSPTIVPKGQRKPLPEKYRSKHREGDGYSHSQSSKSGTTSNNNGGSAEGLSGGVSEDPDGLLDQFEGENEAQFRRLSVDTSDISEEDDRDESSQNIDEVTESPPTTKRPSKKASKKNSKKPKKTTTTTTTPAPEISDDEEESEESEEGDEEEEPAATNTGAQGFIVNRGETDSKPPSGLQPPTGNFEGDPVDSEAGRKDNTDGTYITPTKEGPTYIPPTAGPTYIPPTTASPAGYSYPRPADPYLPPRQDNTYLPPRQDNAYLPPRQDNAYLPPRQDNAYLPPKQNDAYLPPRQDNAYLPPRQENTYLPPAREGGYISGTSPPTATYLPPTAPPARYDITYSPLNTYTNSPDSYYRQPSTGYGSPTPLYSGPTAPTHAYGQPHPLQTPIRDYSQQPSREYLPSPNHQGYQQPQQPSREYLPGPPKQYNQGYAPSPPQRQNPGYDTNYPQQPSREYLPARQEPSNQYLPSPQQHSQGYAPSQPQKPSREYLPAPQTPSNDYLPSPPQQQNQGYAQSQPQQPSREYLPSPPQQGYAASPPQQPNREYLPAPQTPNKEYLPSPPQQGYAASPPQQPNREYLPAPQTPNKEYLPSPQQPQGYPASPPQQPNREYLPAPQTPNNEYLPSSPSRDYLPQQQNPSKEYLPSPPQYSAPSQGYSQNSSPLTVAHWPAKYDYEAPTSPSTVQQYAAPTQAPAHGYSTIKQVHNHNQYIYQTAERGLVPPAKEFGHSNQRSQQSPYQQHLQDASPTIQTQYSTIPVQTPPPQDDNNTSKQAYSVRTPAKIDFYQVPLVSYSTVVDSNSNAHQSHFSR